MTFFSSEASGGQKALVLFGGAVAFSFLGLLASSLFFSPERPPRLPVSALPVIVPPPSPAPEPYIPVSYDAPVAPHTKPHTEAEVGRAMDRSNIRALVSNLREAAATDNDGMEKSMLRALKRYGKDARSVIEEEFGNATDRKVVRALQEALAQAR